MKLQARRRQLLCQLQWLALLVAWLYAIGWWSVVADDLGVLLLFTPLWLALASLLFWRARQKRQLLLSAAIQPHSRLRVWLAGGVLMLVIQLLLALPLALGLFVSLSQGIGDSGWLMLLLALLLWVLLDARLGERLAAVLKPRAAHWSRLSLTSGLMLLVLLLPLLVWRFWQPLDDLSALTLVEAFRYGQSQALGQSQWLQQWAGVWLGLDAVRLWLSQTTAAGLDSPALVILLWGTSLLQGLLFVLPLLLLMQGASLLAARASTAKPAASVWANVRSALALLVLLLPAVLLWNQLAAKPWVWLNGKTAWVKVADHYYQLPPDELLQRLDRVMADNSQRRGLYARLLEARVDSLIDALFRQGLERVPAYADWYYSLQGEAQRLWLSWQEDPVALAEKTRELLFPKGELQRQMKQLDELLRQRSSVYREQLESRFLTRLQQALAAWRAHPQRVAQQHPKVLQLEPLYRQAEFTRLATARSHWRLQAAGATAGVTLAVQGVARRLLARQAGKLAVSAAARGVGGRAASLLACSMTGPAFLLCSGVSLVVVAVATEVAALKWDEARHREALEAALRKRLERQRERLKRQYHQYIRQRLAGPLDDIRARVVAQFYPAQTVLGSD